jgi:ABC-type glutathione transport system ATPase component
MPVPVAITHPKRAPILATTHAELPTEGPFARLSRSQAETCQTTDTTPAILPTDGAALSQPHAAPNSSSQASPALETHNLSFWYSDIDGRPLADRPPVVQDMSISLPKGATCLLIGPNGAGKTTLLKVLGGKHMVPETAVSVLGEPPFHSTQLTSSGALSYVGGNWERDVAFAGYSIPLAVSRCSSWPFCYLVHIFKCISLSRTEEEYGCNRMQRIVEQHI